VERRRPRDILLQHLSSCIIFFPHYPPSNPAAPPRRRRRRRRRRRCRRHRRHRRPPSSLPPLTDSPGASNNVASQPFHPRLNYLSLPVTSAHPTSPDVRLWKAAGALGVAAGRAISAANKMSLA